MTTVAYSDGVLAADTQLSDEALVYRVQKIDELPDGSLIGGAGDWSRAFLYMQWMKSESAGPPPKLKGAILLRITPDGCLWLNEGGGFYPLLNKNNVAIGSGAQAAMALMEQGKSAVEAIKAVTQLDQYTSNPVQALTLSGWTKPAHRRGSAASTPASPRKKKVVADT